MAPTVADVVRDLPAPVARNIEDVVGQATSTFGDTLRSIVLFGSAAENRLRATSDVNLLFVVTRFDPPRIDAMADVLRRAHAAVQLTVMWLLEDEVVAASEAFAVKFADIIRRHRVLFGPDPCDGLTISRQALITRLRQVLLNLVLRLRSSYAADAEHEERLVVWIAESASPLRTSAAELLELAGTPARTPRDAVQQLAGQWSAAKSESFLTSIRTARETRQLEPGAARPVFVDLIEFAGYLHQRARSLR